MRSGERLRFDRRAVSERASRRSAEGTGILITPAVAARVLGPGTEAATTETLRPEPDPGMRLERTTYYDRFVDAAFAYEGLVVADEVAAGRWVVRDARPVELPGGGDGVEVAFDVRIVRGPAGEQIVTGVATLRLDPAADWSIRRVELFSETYAIVHRAEVGVRPFGGSFLADEYAGAVYPAVDGRAGETWQEEFGFELLEVSDAPPDEDVFTVASLLAGPRSTIDRVWPYLAGTVLAGAAVLLLRRRPPAEAAG